MEIKPRKIASIIVGGFFIILALVSINPSRGSSCGCNVPSVSIPSYADSWEDKSSNWTYKECAIAKSNEITEIIHIYIYYNPKMDKYRCELRYSWPGNDCMGSSKIFGMYATSTADISSSIYHSGEWKTYNYWLSRQ